MQTINQKVANIAFQYLEEVENLGLNKDKYLSRVKKLPSMITHNGLLITLSFLYSKGELKSDSNKEKPNKVVKGKSDKDKKKPNEDLLILYQLVRFLKAYPKVEKEILTQKGADEEIKNECYGFIKSLTNEKFYSLMLMSRRALLLAQWLKRLAEGKYGDEEKKNEGN